MKNKLIYKILFAAVLGLGLISCTNDLSQRGEISFSVPEQLFQTIANRNVIDTEQSSVSKDTQLTLKIDLYEADGQIIDSISKTNTYETWLNLSKRGSVVFNFNSIEIGKAVYAELTLSANEGKKNIEICKEKSNTIVIGRRNNVLRFTLTFESKKDEPVNPVLIDTYNSFIINDGLLDLSITPDDILYINSGTITIKAVSKLDGSDLSMDPDIEWTASLLYGNKDINNYSPSSDKKYYRFSATNGPRIQIINQLTCFGTYQLYVTAKYNGIITSQLFNIEVEELAYFNLNTEDSDFGNKLYSIQNSLAIPALLKISGETSQTTFETIIDAINIINVALDVDLGGITGITELTNSYPFSNNNAYSIILP